MTRIMNDEQIDNFIDDARSLLLSASKLNYDTAELSALQSIAASNLVIVEYLQRINERVK